jgi:hypothetical protein
MACWSLLGTILPTGFLSHHLVMHYYYIFNLWQIKSWSQLGSLLSSTQFCSDRNATSASSNSYIVNITKWCVLVQCLHKIFSFSYRSGGFRYPYYGDTSQSQLQGLTASWYSTATYSKLDRAWAAMNSRQTLKKNWDLVV